MIDSSITPTTKNIIVIHNGWGELSMLLALAKPQIKCFGVEKDEDKYIVAKYTAENRVDNLTISKEIDSEIYDINSTLTILIEPANEDKKKYEYLKPIIIN